MEVTYNATDYHEPDDDHHDFTQTFCIGSLVSINLNLILEELEADVEIEDSAYSDGPKESNKPCLSPFFNLVDFLVRQRNEWRTAKE